MLTKEVNYFHYLLLTARYVVEKHFHSILISNCFSYSYQSMQLKKYIFSLGYLQNFTMYI